jgi:hypothetical protein
MLTRSPKGFGLVSAALAASLACGCGHEAPPVAPQLQKRIDAAIASLQGDDCFVRNKGGDTSGCEWADYEIGPAQFKMARSTGEAIMVIDELLPSYYPDLVRYRNRILGFYEVQPDKVVPRVVSAHLPRRLGDVLVSFAGPEFIPARSLFSIAKTAGPIYATLDYPAHGGEVLGHLLDLVPEQPLVLVNMAHITDVPPELCKSIDAETLSAARTRISAMAASLKQVIDDNHVHFINASFGVTGLTLAADWQGACGSAAPDATQLRRVLEVYRPLYDVLLNSEGVVTSHAGAAQGAPEDFPFDQASADYPNQVRVGFFSSIRSGLDGEGRGTLAKVEQFPGAGDVDVFLGWGCDGLGNCAEPHYQIVSSLGLSMGTVPTMSTSFVNPLGVARLVNLRYANHADAPLSNALIETLKQELTPARCGSDGKQRCQYQDPIAHRQLEPFRLHYQ